jgi:alginate biosynthesis protein Alg44
MSKIAAAPAPQTQIVHESETQRQHVRLPLPAQAEIGGKIHDVKDLSSGGVGIRGVVGDYKRGQHVNIRLRLPFTTFSFDVNLEAEVQHYDKNEKVLGCLFVNLTADQISLLNHVLRAFMAGDIIGTGDLLQIATRNNFGRARNQIGNAADRAAPSLSKQIPGMLLVAFIGFILAAFVIGNIYDSLFIVRTTDALVVGPAVQVRAPSEGLFKSALNPEAPTVTQGQQIGSVKPSAGGSAAELQSPCNCYVSKTYNADGDYVSAGAKMVSLVPMDAKPWIVADVDPSLVAKLPPEAKATIVIVGTKATFTGHVASTESGLVDADRPSTGSPVVLKIVADQKIPLTDINKPATITFATR